MSDPSVPPPAEFLTDHIYLAALILTRGDLCFTGIKASGRHAHFVFLDPDDRGSALESEFLNHDPAVPIKKLKSALETLRGKLRSAGIFPSERGR